VDGIVNEDLKDYISIIVFLIIVLGGLVLIGSCNGGWSVAGIDVSPSDSIYTNFMIIVDQDSVQHWYVRTTAYGGILIGDNWCHKHEQWETVEKK
tara:strand:- start:740 stop:1024 length:285 start_codon:yes stop_codon:yes gene_type:complete